jgi:hypothetical protein
MSILKLPLSVEEICLAIRGALNKIDGIYYSKHRSWLYFTPHSDEFGESDCRKIQTECCEKANTVQNANGILKDEDYRCTALSKLPLCAAHNSEGQFSCEYSFFELLSKKGESHSERGQMPLRRLAEIYLDLAKYNWMTSNVLQKSLEQLLSYSYEPEFGSLLCCALMSGWYSEVINIIIPRAQWLGKEKIGNVYIKTKKESGAATDNPSTVIASRDFRILEFIAKWFDECAVNMLKGVSERDPFNYYVFECEKKQRIFFVNDIENAEKRGGNSEHTGRRYAFLAALFYQLDYALYANVIEADKGDKEKLNFFWKMANCYANAAHTKEAAYFVEKAEELFEKVYPSAERETPLGNDLLVFCGDMMNIHYLHERYDRLVETWKILMPNGEISECDGKVSEKCIGSVKRKIIIFSASRYRFTSGIKKYKQSLLTDCTQKQELEAIVSKMWKQFEDAINAKNVKQIIASLFARTVFFKDTDKLHFYINNSDKELCAKQIIEQANNIEAVFENTSFKNVSKEKNVWMFFKAMILLKYAVSKSVEFEGKKVNQKSCNYETEQRLYLEAAWNALKKITGDENFLMRSKFAIDRLKEIENFASDGDTECIYNSLLFMYMTFRIQDILAISVDEISAMKDLCLYTDTSNLNHWLSTSTYKGLPLTMMNVNYFNDPLEGRIVPDFVIGDNSNYSPSKVFVKSFTLNYDNLPMWDRYADNGNGVCIRLDPSSFGRSAENLLTSNESEIIAARVDDSNSVYRVVYCKTGNDSTDSEFEVSEITRLGSERGSADSSYIRTQKEVQELINEMKNVKAAVYKRIQKMPLNKQETFKKVLDYYAERVSYLFKSEDHKSEQELRVISYDYDLVRELPSEQFQRLAVVWGNTVNFEEIMFGPRVADAVIDSYTPYLQLKMDYINRWMSNKDDFKFSRSKIKTR